MARNRKTRQLITSVYEPPLRLDRSVARRLKGRLVSLELPKPAVLTTLAGPDIDVVGRPRAARRKADDCCENVRPEPIAGIVATSLSPDFSKFVVEVVASHDCGIEAIGGHICIVSYRPDAQGNTVRHLEIFRIGGNVVGDGQAFSCPSTETIRFHTLTFPTRGLIGVRFMARIMVASCCSDRHNDTGLVYIGTSDKFII